MLVRLPTVTANDETRFQIGFIVLIGLAAKNAILIVEFAQRQEMNGKERITAVIEAYRLRLRPILMTSFAFILGVFPLIISDGAAIELASTFAPATNTAA